ncbi:MAG TPA: hypothetical protein VH114_12170 [Candidatus Acidoferrum sp.]|jgi:hypothetical protein|nr:hypothetical protein [Candidatus Acidoferrum sp.]
MKVKDLGINTFSRIAKKVRKCMRKKHLSQKSAAKEEKRQQAAALHGIA